MADMEKSDRIWDRAIEALERGKEELTKISRVGRMKLDLTRLQRERAELYRKLGEETHKLFKEDRFHRQEIERLLVRIDQVTEQIHQQEQEMTGTAHPAHKSA